LKRPFAIWLSFETLMEIQSEFTNVNQGIPDPISLNMGMGMGIIM